MTDAQLLELMARYRLAYGAADEKTLAAVVSDDFQRHMHYSDAGEMNATGKILFGVEAMVQEIRRRQASWRNLKYENLVERAAGDFILQCSRPVELMRRIGPSMSMWWICIA